MTFRERTSRFVAGLNKIYVSLVPASYPINIACFALSDNLGMVSVLDKKLGVAAECLQINPFNRLIKLCLEYSSVKLAK